MTRLKDTLRSDPLLLPYYLPSIILAISWGLLAPVLPLFARELHDSYALIGLVLSGEAIGMLLGDVPAGVLAGRFGQKRTMLVGAGIAALATFCLFFTYSIPMAVGLRFISGVGRALYTVSRHGYVASVARVSRRGRAIAFSGGLMRVGRFIGPMAGGAIAAATGLRSTFVVFALGNLAALVVIAAFVEVKPGRAQAAHTGAPRKSVLLLIRENLRILASAGAGQMFAQTIRAGRTAIVPLYAADVLGLDVQAIGLLQSLGSAVDMSLFYPAGWIMDRKGRKVAIVPAFALQGVGMLLIPLTSSFAGLLGAVSVIAVGNGLSSGSMMTLGADLAPPESQGEFLGVWRFIGDSGSTLGPLAVGQVAQMVALPTAAVVMACCGFAAAAVFGLLMPEPLKRQKPRQAASG